MSTGQRVVAIVGPTASGKSALAMCIASGLNAEIVSIDSAQVYRGMDIGTAKPTGADRNQVRHHMVDIAEPSEDLSVKDFRDHARAAIDDISARGRLPLLVGGSGLYFRAVVDPLEFPGTSPDVRQALYDEADDVGAEALYARLGELDPDAASRIEPANTRRVVRALEVIELTGERFSSFRTAWDDYESIYDLAAVGLAPPKELLDERIDARVTQMVSVGLFDEVKGLVEKGLRDSVTSVQALGYAQSLGFLDGELTRYEAIEEIKRRTRGFARRQLSWFKADPRIVWFESADEAGAALRDRLGED